MKRRISVLLVAALILTMFAIPAKADSEVLEFDEFGSTLIVLWDSILLDGKPAKEDPVTYL